MQHRQVVAEELAVSEDKVRTLQQLLKETETSVALLQAKHHHESEKIMLHATPPSLSHPELTANSSSAHAAVAYPTNLHNIERDLRELTSSATVHQEVIPMQSALPPGSHPPGPVATRSLVAASTPPTGNLESREMSNCRQEVHEAKANVQAKIKALRGSIATLNANVRS